MIIENLTGYTNFYFITITLKPIMYKTPDKLQYLVHIKLLSELLQDYEYLIIPEHTKSYNIHFHGIIRSRMDLNNYKKKPFDFYVHKIFRNHKTIGFIKVEPINDFNKCMLYILKDIEKTYEILDLILISEDHNIMDKYHINIELNNVDFVYSDYIFYKQLKYKMEPS